MEPFLPTGPPRLSKTPKTLSKTPLKTTSRKAASTPPPERPGENPSDLNPNPPPEHHEHSLHARRLSGGWCFLTSEVSLAPCQPLEPFLRCLGDRPRTFVRRLVDRLCAAGARPVHQTPFMERTAGAVCRPRPKAGEPCRSRRRPRRRSPTTPRCTLSSGANKALVQGCLAHKNTKVHRT